MKIDRLIGIITILLNQDKVTAPWLAERFEVSRRTIQRDIEDICKAGIPLVTLQGHGGGITIAEGYKIDKSLLTREEMQALLAGLKGMDSVSRTSHASSLLDKLSSKENTKVSQDAIIIDLASHYQGSLTPKIESIKKAIYEKYIISFEYCYVKGETFRKIEPYYLVFKWSSWYVFGYCPDRKAYRLFKLNKLWNLSLTSETYIPRNIPEEELDFDRYFTSNEIHLKAVFAESEKHRLVEEYGTNCYFVLEEGELLFEWSFTSYENLLQWILSFGDKVKVLEPDRLRADRFRQAENILKELKET